MTNPATNICVTCIGTVLHYQYTLQKWRGGVWGLALPTSSSICMFQPVVHVVSVGLWGQDT